jgi:heme-degrading monooxygenase HmoA
MSVIMTLKVKADPAKWEQVAQSDPDRIKGVVEAAKGHGLIAHRFYGSDSGEVMVVDEWPDADSFQAFFSSQQDTIGPMMQEAGVTSEPDVTFWRKLETGDDYGWDA